jgi:SCP-2 sterol transfer family
LRIKTAEGKEGVWTIDLKKDGTVYKGPAKSKADVTLIMSDETLESLAGGKVREHFFSLNDFDLDMLFL